MLFDYFYLALVYIVMLSRSSYACQISVFLFRNQTWKPGDGGAFLFGFFFSMLGKFRAAAEVCNLYSSCCKESVLSSYAVCVLGRKCSASQRFSLWWNTAPFISIKATCAFTWQGHLQGDFSATAMSSYPLIQFNAPDATSVNSVVAGSKCYKSSSGGQTCC